MTQFRPSESVVCETVESEAVLLDLKKGVYFSLNPLGTFVWQRLQDGDSTSVIADRVVADFDVGRDVASADIEQLLSMLVAHGLVEQA